MRTVLITGASTGIGKETAMYFAERGWNVAASMRNLNSTDFNKYPNISKYHLDVNDEKSISEAIKATIEKFGAINVVVNNAGYAAAGAFECATPQQIKKQFDVNVFGLMNVTRTILPHFRKNNSGTIINLASVAGHAGFPTFTLYNSTKFAIEGFSESLQYELRQFKIKVKIVEPGPIKTDFYDRSMDKIENPEITEYDNFINPAMKKMTEMGMKGLPPIAVAKTIFKAAMSNSNKLRYPVAFQAAAMIKLRHLLPGCLFRSVVRLVMK
jgi:short-subunit dehydrogenase